MGRTPRRPRWAPVGGDRRRSSSSIVALRLMTTLVLVARVVLTIVASTVVTASAATVVSAPRPTTAPGGTTVADGSRRNEDGKRKKIAVVHVGPHKTGTTSIQSSTRIYRDAFRADGYLVVDFDPTAGLRDMTPGHLGRRPTQVIAYCSCRDDPGPNATEEEIREAAEAEAEAGTTPDCDEVHYRRIRDALTDPSDPIRKWNLIFSMEDLDNPCVNIHEIRDLLVPHWDVRIVVGYRRFFDWAASYYYQQNRVDRRIDGRRRGRGSSWPSAARNATAPVNVRTWWTEERMMSQYHERRYSTAVFGRYRDVFGEDSVSILNVHDQEHGDVVENFFCDVVPHATDACRALRTRDPDRDEKPNPNRGGTTAYDEVAVAAYLSGLLVDGEDDANGGSDVTSTSVSRPDVREWIRFRQEDMLNLTAGDFPMDCGGCGTSDDDDPWLGLLLDLSLTAERTLAPTSLLGPHGEVELREEFKKAAASSSKLCAVDTGVVLHDPGWIAFFRSMSGRGRSSSLQLPSQEWESPSRPSGARESTGIGLSSGLPFAARTGRRLPMFVVVVMPVAVVSFFLGFVLSTYFGRSLRRMGRRHRGGGGGGKRGSSNLPVLTRRSGFGI